MTAPDWSLRSTRHNSVCEIQSRAKFEGHPTLPSCAHSLLEEMVEVITVYLFTNATGFNSSSDHFINASAMLFEWNSIRDKNASNSAFCYKNNFSALNSVFVVSMARMEN